MDDVIELSVHKYASMYFLVRCMNDAGVVGTSVKEIALHDLQPESGVKVYDLDLHTNLAVSDDLLTSSNRGNVTRYFHHADIDWTNETRGVAGVVTGIGCDLFSWTLQVCL